MNIQPIHDAAQNGDLEKLKKLLKEKPNDVDLTASEDWTPLIYAARDGKLEAVKVLIEHKATVDKTNIFGQTALQIACFAGYGEIAEFLLDNGADMNKADSFGRTPLIRAARGDDSKCVKLLLERKADRTQKAIDGESKGKTALDVAEDYKIEEIVSMLRFASTAAPPPAPPAPAPHVELSTSNVVEKKTERTAVGEKSLVILAFYPQFPFVMSQTRLEWRAR